MLNSRRQFLATSLALAAAAYRSEAQTPGEPQPGSPPAFGTGPLVGPEVSPATFAEAEKLVQIQMSEGDRALAAASWRQNLASLYERRTGPRKVPMDGTLAPASRWKPVSPELKAAQQDRFIRSNDDAGPLPSKDDDIAFAPLTRLSRWIEQRKLNSERLTRIYLDRLQRFDPKLRCVITLTRDLAFAQAKRADAEINAGKYRGALHGIGRPRLRARLRERRRPSLRPSAVI